MDGPEVLEWENCKENVQPLRHGRRIANLTAALHHVATTDQLLRSQRESFEIELRSYTGNDPLEVWLRYIQWTEQNFPSGGNSGHFNELLESTIQKFDKDKRYTEDPRFLNVWLRLIMVVKDPLELFTYLYSKKSFSKLAAFYEAWASEHEKIGNIQRADEVYCKGLEIGAEPTEILIKRHSEFQARTLKRVIQEVPNNQEDDQRTILGTLHTMGPQHLVPVERAKAVISNRLTQQAPSLSLSSHKHVDNKKFTIYSDSSQPSIFPPQSGSRIKVPSHNDRVENEIKAGKWTDAKLKQSSKSGGNYQKKMSFDVHEDEHNQQIKTTPHSKTYEMNVLSTRKPDQSVDLLRLLKLESNANERYMFNKEMVYAGTLEFSFEENRALRYRRNANGNQPSVGANFSISQPAMNIINISNSISQPSSNTNLSVYGCNVSTSIDYKSKELDKNQTDKTEQPQISDMAIYPHCLSSLYAEDGYLLSRKSSTLTFGNGKIVYPDAILMCENPGVSIEEIMATMWQRKRRKVTSNKSASACLSETVSMNSNINETARKSLNFSSQPDSASLNCSQNKVHISAKVTTVCPSEANLTNKSDKLCVKEADLTSGIKSCTSNSLIDAQPMFNFIDTLSTRNSSQYAANTKNLSLVASLPIQSSSTNMPSINVMNQLTEPKVLNSGSVNSESFYQQHELFSRVSVTICDDALATRHNVINNSLPESHILPTSSASTSLTNTSSHTSQGQRDISESSTGRTIQNQSSDYTRDLPGNVTNKSINNPQSVTMNTAEAVKEVLAMFNKTLDSQKHPTWESPSEDDECSPYLVKTNSIKGTLLPQVGWSGVTATDCFNVYEDTGITSNNMCPVNSLQKQTINTALITSSSNKLTAPFVIFDDCPAQLTNKTEPIIVFEDPPAVISSIQKSGHNNRNGPFIDKENSVPVVVTLPYTINLPNDEEIEDVEMKFDDKVITGEKHVEMEFPELNETFGNFAPNLESTRCYPSFPAASTPFCPSEPAMIPDLRISTIKPFSAEMTMQPTATSISLTSISENDATKCVRRTSMFGTGNPVSSLSPITERSDENLRSRCSTIGSSSSGSSGDSTAATTRHLTTNMSSMFCSKVGEKTLSHKFNSHVENLQRSAAQSICMPQSVSLNTNALMSSNISNRNISSVSNSTVQNDVFVGSKSTLLDISRKGHHEIDLSTYVPNNSNQVEQQLNASIFIDPRNPFDVNLIAKFLSKLVCPLSSYPTYKKLNGSLSLRVNSKFMLGDTPFQVVRLLGQGANAKAYLLQSLTNSQQVVAKVQSPPCPWEFYISNELQSRLASTLFTNVRNSVMIVEAGFFHEEMSVLVNEFHSHGSLLNVANAIKQVIKSTYQLEILLILLTVELIRIVEAIHNCRIIHGDIKPDNFLIRDIPNLEEYEDPQQLIENLPLMLKLIDWGQAIDMNFFSPDTTFTAKVTTSGFQCIEMITNRPWTYQTDLFGLIGSIHVLFFNKYMKVFQERGRWRITSSFGRGWKCASILSQLFDTMLNIEDCDNIPQLKPFREQLEQFLIANAIPVMLQQSLRQLETAL